MNRLTDKQYRKLWQDPHDAHVLRRQFIIKAVAWIVLVGIFALGAIGI